MKSNLLLAKLEKQADSPGVSPAPGKVNTPFRNMTPPGPADPDFSLRTGFMNPMCDAAMSLIGLAMNLQALDEYEDVETLHRLVHTQITNIVEEMHQRSYEPVLVSAYSYALCLYLDETVMRTPWGRNSSWSQHPLLGEFHDETTGGDRFFNLLANMMQEPKRYQDVLEFMYLVLCMGLKGKYAIARDGKQVLERHITELRKAIRDLRGPLPDLFPDALAHVAPHKPGMRRYWPWWSPLLVAVGTIAAMYSYFSYQLHLIRNEVVASLNSILLQ
ncbi:type IVB secretion system protein IcmH/DotU [Pseudomonas sp. TWI929]|uniref:type IVB secretion system protein IcmH/DotU n=1 Tax=Pseudomonas sp. TWI929 TaxID=3136795 RepID=UPI003208E7CD